jgi:hypothetical protein
MIITVIKITVDKNKDDSANDFCDVWTVLNCSEMRLCIYLNIYSALLFLSIMQNVAFLALIRFDVYEREESI